MRNGLKIVMLARAGFSTSVIYNELSKKFVISKVILEAPESRRVFFKRRIKKFGLGKVLGQICFMLFISKSLTFFARTRKNEIISYFGFSSKMIDNNRIINVRSANDNYTIKILKEINPEIVIVNGTRILSKSLISSINGIFVNMHAGITPKYRGVHGGYWALVNQDEKLCGVTVHLIDEGIDTGSVLYQALIKINREKDNLTTYPILQLGVGLVILIKVIEDYKNNDLKLISSLTTESKLWYHPTAYEYIYNRLLKGVK